MFKRNLTSRILLLVLIVLLGFNAFVFASSQKAPKYVFYFIGDGLGSSQRQAAEYFLQVKTGDNTVKLVMNQFPVAGINTTHSLDSLVTDSAAAGTALATGFKTDNGMIAQLPDGTNVKTLVEAAEEKGMATGIITTMRLTHATPAVFAAHNQSRGNENEIAVDYLDSGVEFFAGGGYRHFVPQNGELKSKRKDDRNLIEEFEKLGYKIFVTENDTEKFRNYKPVGKEKVFAVFTYSHLPYEIDRNDNVPSLAELTQKGIEVLSKYENGFFMMVEGGKIDYASHANDPAGVIHDVLAFDKAIAKAYEFYKQHPEETLIVIIGDHETGGFGLGFGDNYFLKLQELMDVKASVDSIRYKGDREALYKYLAENFGLDDLTDKEKAELERAMDMADAGEKIENGPSWLSPVNAAVAHIVSERANLFWTTYAHTGTAIPMSAIGVGAANFGGFKDNSEIAKTMADLMGFKLTELK
ncbi:alkaline phosphatase [Anoxybacter fermentans]|uniref:Alkaline phosphatase n=1 Tax=Anoxybacter fermentans TaxID=1323375 RepID=A0A3Q9HRL9_9FIRM|nr:alkaline phosphatase [Anoxybacter fermentans]AZR73755.1 alkaline phosphatase [Anoxybacter fermentans]